MPGKQLLFKSAAREKLLHGASAFTDLRLVGRRSHSLAGPTLLSTDPQVFSTHRFKAARSQQGHCRNRSMARLALDS